MVSLSLSSSEVRFSNVVRGLPHKVLAETMWPKATQGKIHARDYFRLVGKYDVMFKWK